MILILVESPGKARSVAQYARGVFQEKTLVRATLGHLRDLPPNSLGIDIGQGFSPVYRLRNPKAVTYLRSYVRSANTIYLAMDPDREGEAIAWHVTKVFAAELHGKAVWRVSFRAITRQAVQRGLSQKQQIDLSLVRAAVARRVIDRMIGYQLSPRLWAHVDGTNLSAGRVQTAALRLLKEQDSEAWDVQVDL
jgi:DNA topoisomerase-1